ncbi:UDP-3-O-acylglucosamine N-acyltransferase [Dissostichus eleginoides]|uniref:UDP-3-O-acylglucosamine N-acyltransferase n=1 Tax=Dissostichus eleginoides TaxID=100907 RepID=A0AAD9CKQ3_DISEL|nr:UDP-3-O-acylglucosamine N-acyltransferase [Dissostichus eleginoides]
MDKARTAITQHRGDPSNRRHLLGFFQIQFGFRWVVENSLGCAAYLVAAMIRDPTGGSKDSKEHSLNKACFKEYIELFSSGRIAIAMKEERYAANAPQHTPPAQQAGTSQHASTSSLRSLLAGQKMPNQRSLTNAVKRLVSPSKTKPSLVHARARPKPHLIQLPVSFEAAKAPASTLTHLPPASTLTHPAVSSEVDDSTLLAEAVQFEEANPAAGLHQKIRQVVAVGKMYFVASEYLSCRRCKRKVISWSHGLISQLDIGHRVQFPCILTSKLACDFEVASLMRQRGLGNSSSQIQRKLQERHAEVWMQKTVQYLQDCKGIASAVT